MRSVNMGAKDGLVVMGRVTIDTRAPFRSVKDAVMLFGEKFGEIHAKQLKEIKAKAFEEEHEEQQPRPVVTVTPTAPADQLEETKRSLSQAREEGQHMAKFIRSLNEELDQTKKELHQLKMAKEFKSREAAAAPASPLPTVLPANPDIEEIKFVETNASTPNHVQVGTAAMQRNHENDIIRDENKRIVRFASPPLLTKEIYSSQPLKEVALLDRAPSFTQESARKKKSSSVIGWLFPRKKKHMEA